MTEETSFTIVAVVFLMSLTTCAKIQSDKEVQLEKAKCSSINQYK